MGYGMAGNVRKNMAPSSVLYVYDVVSSACERFIEEFRETGPIMVIKTPLEGVEQSHTLISMVPGGANVRDIYLDGGEGSVVHASPADRLFLECSTIDVQTTREVGNEITQRGLGHYVDAPVSVSLPGYPHVRCRLLMICRAVPLEPKTGRCRFSSGTRVMLPKMVMIKMMMWH